MNTWKTWMIFFRQTQKWVHPKFKVHLALVCFLGLHRRFGAIGLLSAMLTSHSAFSHHRVKAEQTQVFFKIQCHCVPWFFSGIIFQLATKPVRHFTLKLRKSADEFRTVLSFTEEQRRAPQRLTQCKTGLDVTILNFKHDRITVNYRMQSNSNNKFHILLLETAKPTELRQKSTAKYTPLWKDQRIITWREERCLGFMPIRCGKTKQISLITALSTFAHSHYKPFYS